jgi:hypothetical protein
MGVAAMTVRSWMVKSWPQVRLQVTDDFRGMPEFQHISTLWREDLAGREGRVGETVWAARLGNQDVVGLAWEWVEVRPGLVALLDPNAMISNAKLVGEDGVELDELRAIIAVNVVSHAVPWQARALDVIGGRAAGDGAADGAEVGAFEGAAWLQRADASARAGTGQMPLARAA